MQIDSTQMKQPQVFELSQKSWDIMYHSTMTLILIKAPTTEEEAGVSQACLQAARAGLRCHLACFSSYQTADSPGLVSEGEYASWLVPLLFLLCFSFLTRSLGFFISHR
jgi:hypothetical protein